MGLHVSSVAELGEINSGLERIDYYMYFLNYYQFSDAVVDAFLRELPKLSNHFEKLGNAVVISSVTNFDFYSETLSWHNICGINPSEFGPALLICTLPPSNFGPNSTAIIKDDQNAPWVLLPLNEICETAADLTALLKRLVSSIEQKAPLEDFSVDEIYKYKDRPIISGKKIEYHGLEFDLEEAWRKTKSGVSKVKRYLPFN